MWIAGAAALSVIAAFVVLKYWIFGLYNVPFSSMEPTIPKGSRILVDRRHPTRDIKLGDLLAFESPQQAEVYVQRVVGLPGDRIEVKSKTLYRNGAPLSEPYVQHLGYAGTTPESVRLRLGDMPVIEVPPGQVFLLADNRDHAVDGRWWGAIGFDKVKGKVKKIWPPP